MSASSSSHEPTPTPKKTDEQWPPRCTECGEPIWSENGEEWAEGCHDNCYEVDE